MRKHNKLNKAGSSKRPRSPEKVAPGAPPASEPARRLHDLQDHQVELEMQNRELRETHHLLELSRDRYADLYDFAPVGYLTLDDKGLIHEINLTAAGMLGVERSRLIGMPFSLHVAKNDQPAFRGHLRELAQPGGRAAIELGLTVKGGGTIQVELQSVLLLDARGKTRLCRSTLTDITARQQAEEALRNNEARLRAILDTAAEGIITIDERGVIESFNAAAERIFGYKAGEAIGQNISLLTPSPHREEHDRYLANYRATGARKIIGLEREVPGRRKDASTFPMELTVREVQLGGRRIFTGIVRDITRRKQAEKALIESEQRFRHLVETIKIIAWEADVATWRFTYVAAWAVEVLGYPLTDWFKDGFWVDHIHPEDREVATKYCAERTSQEDDFELEYRMVRADGRTVWFHDIVHVVKGATGPETIKGFLIDITDRKQAEEALRRSEANLARAQKIARVGSYEVRFRGTEQIHWSAEIFRILGLDPRQGELPREEYLTRMVHPDDQVRVRERVEETLRTGAGYELEYRIVRPDGSLRHLHSIAEPVLGPDKKLSKLVGSLQDITERKELEQEILDISEREQSRIGQDLHDGLCQHLAGIEFRLLGLKQKLEGRSRRQAAEATELARLVQAGIEQTRTLARGLSPVMLEPGGLMSALQELAIITEKTFGISCSLTCPAPVPIHNNAVATHLYRIAQEAVQNAVRHGRAKFIVMNLFTQNDRIVLGVKDDGVGFPNKPHKHDGMGLRVMQYRAGMVGGSLVVQREPGGGTSVVCSLRSDRSGTKTERPGARRATG